MARDDPRLCSRVVSECRVGVDLGSNVLNLGTQSLVFFHLARQKSMCKARLLGQTLAGQHVGMAPLVIGGRELAQLDEALVYKGIEYVMSIPVADPHRLCQLALRHFRVVVEQPKDTEFPILTKLNLAGFHVQEAFAQATAQGLA